MTEINRQFFLSLPPSYSLFRMGVLYRKNSNFSMTTSFARREELQGMFKMSIHVENRLKQKKKEDKNYF